MCYNNSKGGKTHKIKKGERSSAKKKSRYHKATPKRIGENNKQLRFDVVTYVANQS